VQTLPYEEALGYVGLRLIREQAREPYNGGLSLEPTEVSAEVVIANVRENSPAEDAGLQQGDELLSIGGKKVSRENWLSNFARFKTGDRVPISIRRDGRVIQTTIVLGAPERFEYRIEEKADATASQKALRTAWLK
jgi:predicted metalloprotease with PDZ domain